MIYEIRVRGTVQRTVVVAFHDLTVRVEGSTTVFTGDLADQAALAGVLNRVQALGLVLLDVHAVGADDAVRRPSREA